MNTTIRPCVLPSIRSHNYLISRRSGDLAWRSICVCVSVCVCVPINCLQDNRPRQTWILTTCMQDNSP